MTDQAQAERLTTLAAAFLQEAVFASREVSHAAAFQAPHGGCGLGGRPTLAEAWSSRQLQKAGELAAAVGLAAEYPRLVEACDAEAARWVRLQDGLDRKRNHFLKDFRAAHGFDRRAYPPEVEGAFKEGLERINADNREQLEAAARGLVSRLSEALAPTASNELAPHEVPPHQAPPHQAL
jgi:hypothetical protein